MDYNSAHELAITDAIAKTHSVMAKHVGKNVRVAYSGGSDSDSVMWLLRDAGYNVTGVLYDTGVEWEATMRHVEYMRSVGFDVETIKARRPVPTSNKRYGHPFINKRVSDYIQRLQSKGFDFQVDGPKPFDELYTQYPKSKVALRWWCNDWGNGSSFNIERNTYLKEFLIEYGLPFKVSGKCCDGAKKLPIKDYTKEFDIDLMILGIRKAEGGSRAGAYRNCYLPKRSYTYAMYFPLFWWGNGVKEYYDETRGIKHSDCYSEYGLTRTGCAGCPFGINFEHELGALMEHEPKKAKGILAIFNPSYEWTRKYKIFQQTMKAKKKLGLTEIVEEEVVDSGMVY